MIDPALEHALEHLSRSGGLVILRARNREQARIALSRLHDRARLLALDVRLRFGFSELRRADDLGRIKVLVPGEAADGAALELELA